MIAIVIMQLSLTRQTRLRKAAVEGRLAQRPSCGVAGRQIGEGRIPQDRRAIDVMHLRRRGLWRVVPAYLIVADSSANRARRHPGIVVRRRNVRSNDFRCGVVGDRKMRCRRRRVRYGEMWCHIRSGWREVRCGRREMRCGRREMRRGRREMRCWSRDVRSDNWLLRFRVGHQSGQDEGYRTYCNRSHDHNPIELHRGPIRQSDRDR